MLNARNQELKINFHYNTNTSRCPATHPHRKEEVGTTRKTFLVGIFSHRYFEEIFRN